MDEHTKIVNLFRDLGFWSGAVFSSYDPVQIHDHIFDNSQDDNAEDEHAQRKNNVTPCTTSQALSRVDPLMLKVRKAVCLIGFDWFLLQNLKNQISSLTDRHIALESFHIHHTSDLLDGTLLVPKVIAVVQHNPGQKLIDEEGNEGRLDFVYDEICETGADLLVIYTGLPKCIYKPIRHMVYHPRLIDLVFPQSKILQDLAEEHSLITTVEGNTLNNMQKNAITEWLRKPVYSSHPVFNGASKLFDKYFPIWMKDDFDVFSETELANRMSPAGSPADDFYQSAREEHPLADKKKKKSKRKLLRLKDRFRKKEEHRYTALEDVAEQSVPAADRVEMSMYMYGGATTDVTIDQMYV